MNVLLVIAEDRAIRESLRAALPETDLLLFESTTDDALRRLITIKADLIVLDETPALDRQTITRLQDATPSTPILVLVGRNDPDTLAHYVLAGARESVPKPFSCDELRMAIERILHPRATPRPEDAPVPTVPQPDISAMGQHQTALRWLSRLSGHMQDPKRLSQGIIDAVTDIFDSVRCAVLLESPGNGVNVIASHGIAPAVTLSLRFGFASGLMRWFEENACLIDRDLNSDAAAAVKQMRVAGARLAAPIIVGGRVRGAILVGDKASGRSYTRGEHELLTVVARCASTSFENSELYQDVSRHRRKLDTVMGNVSAGVVVVMPDKTVSIINQSAERILQVKADDVIGRSVQKLGSGFADVVLRTLADGKARLRQEVHDAAINATLGLSTSPMGDQGVAVMFSPLPEETASTEDVAYSPFWEYLSSRVAQEIKNPMVAVNTFAQLLPTKYDSDDFRKAFSETVQQEVSRINNVVETLFEFARHPRLVLKKANLNDTMKNILRTFESELRARSIDVETDLADEEPTAELDPVFFSQAVHNVLQNSIDAMPDGGILRIQTRKGDDGNEVVISDSGPGISDQDAPLVFTPFFSTKEQGMGLGLTMATRIMKQHSGELKLVSTKDGGSSFAFRLPPNGKNHADDSGH